MNVHDRKVKGARTKPSGPESGEDSVSNDDAGQTVRADEDPGDELRRGVRDTVTRLPSEHREHAPAARTENGHKPLSDVLRVVLQIVLPLAVLAAGVGGYYYLKLTKPEEKKQVKTERAFSVRSAVAMSDTYQPSLTLFGSIVTGRQVDIRALVSGRVVAASDKLREGGEVVKGDVLLAIDAFDYKNALAVSEAQLKEAVARKQELEASIVSDTASLAYANRQTKLAITDLERAKPLVKRGTVSRKTMDDRQQVVLQRQQAADQLKNGIDVWKTRVVQQDATIARLRAAVSFARRRLEETQLKSPFNAYVSEVSSHVGRMVSANDKVATLLDRDWIEARFTMTDEQFGRIVSSEGSLVGRKVSVDWVLGGTTFTYAGKVERLGARVSSTSGGVEVFARIDRPGTPIPIRPGAFVEIRVPDTKFVDVFKLASTSLYSGNTVFVIQDRRLVSRKVEVVGSDGSEILVRGDLKAGDRVLKTRISTPGDGILVKEVLPQ